MYIYTEILTGVLGLGRKWNKLKSLKPVPEPTSNLFPNPSRANLTSKGTQHRRSRANLTSKGSWNRHSRANLTSKGP